MKNLMPIATSLNKPTGVKQPCVWAGEMPELTCMTLMAN